MDKDKTQQDRLAAALRENLKKRKQQKRARAYHSVEQAETESKDSGSDHR